MCACDVDDSGRSEITLQRKEIEKHLATAMKCVYFEGYAFVPVIHIAVLTVLNVNLLVIYSHRKVSKPIASYFRCDDLFFSLSLLFFCSVVYCYRLLHFASQCSVQIAMLTLVVNQLIETQNESFTISSMVSNLCDRKYLLFCSMIKHVHSFFVLVVVFFGFVMVLWHRQCEWRTDTHRLLQIFNRFQLNSDLQTVIQTI